MSQFTGTVTIDGKPYDLTFDKMPTGAEVEEAVDAIRSQLASQKAKAQPKPVQGPPSPPPTVAPFMGIGKPATLPMAQKPAQPPQTLAQRIESVRNPQSYSIPMKPPGAMRPISSAERAAMIAAETNPRLADPNYVGSDEQVMNMLREQGAMPMQTQKRLGGEMLGAHLAQSLGGIAKITEAPFRALPWLVDPTQTTRRAMIAAGASPEGVERYDAAMQLAAVLMAPQAAGAAGVGHVADTIINVLQGAGVGADTLKVLVDPRLDSRTKLEAIAPQIAMAAIGTPAVTNKLMQAVKGLKVPAANFKKIPLVSRDKIVQEIADSIGYEFRPNQSELPGYEFRPKETPNASKIQSSAEVYGNMPTQPVQGKGTVPTQEGGAGVQSNQAKRFAKQGKEVTPNEETQTRIRSTVQSAGEQTGGQGVQPSGSGGVNRAQEVRQGEIPSYGSQGQEEGIATKNASTSRIRKEMDLQDLPKPERETFEQWMKKAEDLGTDPMAAANRVLSEGGTLETHENGAIVKRLAELKLAYKKADEAGDMQAMGEILDQTDKLTKATNQAGTTAARNLVARKLQVGGDDALSNIVRAQHANPNVQLEPKLKEKITAMSDATEKLNEQISKLEAGQDANLEEVVKATAAKKRLKSKEQLDAELAKILSESKKRMAGSGPKGTQSGAVRIPFDPVAAGQLAWHYVERGASKLEDVIMAVQSHFPDATDRQIRDAMLGKHKEKPSIDAIKAELQQMKRDVRGQAFTTNQIEDMESQLASGNIPDAIKRQMTAPSPELNALRLKRDQLRAQINRIIEDRKPKTLPTKLANIGREAQLSNPINRIVDLAANTTKLVSYMAQNPTRSLISSAAFRGTVGRERTILSPAKLANVFKDAPARWRQEVSATWRGVDPDSAGKFGSSGIFSRLAGITDVGFKDIYTRLALDDWAVGAAKGNKDARMAIWRQLTEGAPGPLSQQEVDAARAVAHDWALRQTFNIDNLASASVGGLKKAPALQIQKRYGKAAADAWESAVDTMFRFSKVIGNVALEKANYNPAIGGGEAAARVLRAKLGGGMGAKISTEEARLIADLAAKGLTGAATFKLGEAAYDWLKDQDWIKGEIASTRAGTKFVRWTLLPDFGGGIDATQLGGITSPMLLGATAKMLDESGLSQKQRDALMKGFTLDQSVSQPILGTASDISAITKGEKNPANYAAMKVASQIPGMSILKEIAERKDFIDHNVRMRKTDAWWDEFIKRIPLWRESLPANEGGAKTPAYKPIKIAR